VARRATTASERNMVVDVEDGDGEGENRKQGGAQFRTPHLPAFLSVATLARPTPTGIRPRFLMTSFMHLPFLAAPVAKVLCFVSVPPPAMHQQLKLGDAPARRYHFRNRLQLAKLTVVKQ